MNELLPVLGSSCSRTSINNATLKTAADVHLYIDTFKNDLDASGEKLNCPSIRKGLLLYLHSLNDSKTKKASKPKATTKRLLDIAKATGILAEQQVVNFETVRIAVWNVLSSVQKIKNIPRDGHNLVHLLNESFCIPFKKVVGASELQSSISSLCVPLPFQTPLERPASPPECDSSLVSINLNSSSTVCGPSPTKRLRSDCQKCVKRRQSMRKLVTRHQKLRKDFNDLYISTSKLRSIRQAFERKQEIETKLRRERCALKKTIAKKDAEIRRLKRAANPVVKQKIQQRHKCKYMM